jgi:hypothetical protein
MKNRMIKTIFLFISAFLIQNLSPDIVFPEETKNFGKKELIEDTRQLATLLESAHPDPYINRGGKINFHRKLQQTLAGIPEEGMNLKAFYRHLLPFVAWLGDGHTALINPEAKKSQRPGIPLQFRVIEKTLYVSGVYQKDHKKLLGAKLISVSGISISILLKRQANLKGFDNTYQNLTNLMDNLKTRDGLQALFPEWKGKDMIEVVLKKYGRKQNKIHLKILDKIPDTAFKPKTKLKIPVTDRKDFAYGILDKKKKIAILKIDGMMGYREAYEMFAKMGLTWVNRGAKKIYKRYHRKEPPKELDKIISGLPSATETFLELVKKMKKFQSKTLVVDLRENSGGNSAISQILLYFLYGKQSVLNSTHLSYNIKKYSDLFFKNYTKLAMDKINADRKNKLEKNDYDFKSESDFLSKNDKRTLKKNIERFLQMMPTFLEEYKSGKFEAHYLPKKIIVLTSARTYSSGFTLAVLLYKKGAFLAGIPSAQAGNCFGDTIGFKLNHTSIKGYLSHKRTIMFPDNPELGKILAPHYELTYKKLANYKFDPNSTILMMLDILHRLY